MKRLYCVLISLLLALSVAPAEATAEETSVTVMLYLCGSDLESDNGFATDDLAEAILGMTDGRGVRVVVETGGSDEWSDFDISSRGNERYEVTEDGLLLLDDSLGARSMGDAETLSSFVSFALEAYPARETVLILWDHGSGPGGVCYDERFDDDMLTLTELNAALSDALPEGERLSMLAYDACLMGSFECAYALRDRAKRILASEETMPGGGLDYETWLSALCDEPDMGMDALGRAMADSCVAYYEGEDTATLSLVDTDALSAVAEALDALGGALEEATDERFASVSRARAGIRSFGEFVDSDASDLVDIRSLCLSCAPIASEETEALASALSECVLYSAATSDISAKAGGLSVYAPYSVREADYAEAMLAAYDGSDELSRYVSFVEAFSRALEGGYSFSSHTPENLYTGSVSAFTGGDLWGGAESESPVFGDLWAGAAQTGEEYYAPGGFNGNLWGGLSDAEPVDLASSASDYFSGREDGEGAVYSIQLTKGELDHLSGAAPSLYLAVDDTHVRLGTLGKGEVDWTSGMVYAMFDGSWPYVGGCMACLTDIGGGRCLVPVAIGGVDMYLLVSYSSDDGKGTVLGATQGYDSETGIPIRGYMNLSEGVEITFTFDALDGSLYEGETLTVGAEPLTVALAPLEEGEYLFGFELTNVYGEKQTTECVELSF